MSNTENLVEATIQSPTNPMRKVSFSTNALVLQELKRLGLPTENVVVNGVPATAETVVQAGDQITALPSKNLTGNS